MSEMRPYRRPFLQLWSQSNAREIPLPYRKRELRMTHPESGAIPEKLWRAKEPALLTVVFTTKKGEVGLMNIYAGVTIVEMNSRYAAVGNPQR